MRFDLGFDLDLDLGFDFVLYIDDEEPELPDDDDELLDRRCLLFPERFLATLDEVDDSLDDLWDRVLFLPSSD